MGPWANTATASPTLTPPLSAPLKPVEKMSGHQHDLLVAESLGNRRQVGTGVWHQQVLGPAPSMVLPKRQPPSGPPHCECAPLKQ